MLLLLRATRRHGRILAQGRTTSSRSPWAKRRSSLAAASCRRTPTPGAVRLPQRSRSGGSPQVRCASECAPGYRGTPDLLLTAILVLVAARLETFSHASVATAMDWHYAMVRTHSTLHATAVFAPPHAPLTASPMPPIDERHSAKRSIRDRVARILPREGGP